MLHRGYFTLPGFVRLIFPFAIFNTIRIRLMERLLADINTFSTCFVGEGNGGSDIGRTGLNTGFSRRGPA
jgi:hypothetical protein